VATGAGEDMPTSTPHVIRAPRVGDLRILHLHPALIVVAGACAALFHQAMHAGLSGDVFYQEAAGAWMLAHNGVIRHDVFSYTVAGRPWLDEEWGFQVMLAWMVKHVGALSYWLLSAGVCSGAVLLSLARWRRTGGGWLWAATLSILATAGLSVGLTPRPQDLSYMFFAALLLVLTAARQNPAWLVAVPPFLLVWANVHGSFLLGLGILALELLWSVLPPLEGRFRVSRALSKTQAALTVVTSFVATLVNPHGPGLLSYAFHVSTSSQLSSLIEEWQSPDFHSYLFLGVIIGPVLLLIALLAFSGTVFALQDVALAGLLFLLTLHAVRFTPYFVLAACAVLAQWSPLRKDSFRPTLLTLPAAAALVAVLLAGTHVPAGTPQVGDGSVDTPVAATSFLEHQTGRVFSTYWWDDYLILKHIPVFVDGRTDLYFGTDILQTWENVANLSIDPDTVFAHWDIRWVMWDKGTALTTYLTSDHQWEVRFRSGDAVVFKHLGNWR
jgi:hypothetical protein